MNHQNIDAIKRLICDLFQKNGDYIKAIDLLVALQDKATNTSTEEQDKALEELEAKQYIIIDDLSTVRGSIRKGLFFHEWENSFQNSSTHSNNTVIHNIFNSNNGSNNTTSHKIQIGNSIAVKENQKNNGSFLSNTKWNGIAAIAGIIGLIFVIFGFLNDKSDSSKKQETPTDIVKKLEYRPDVNLTKIELKHWVGDKEDFFTFYFKNLGKSSAQNFKFNLYMDKTPLHFTKTNTSDIFYRPSYTLEANKETSMPILTTKDIEKALNNGKKVIGLGLDSTMKNSLKNLSYMSIPVLLEFKYKSAMGESFSKTVDLFVYQSSNKKFNFPIKPL